MRRGYILKLEIIQRVHLSSGPHFELGGPRPPFIISLIFQVLIPYRSVLDPLYIGAYLSVTTGRHPAPRCMVHYGSVVSHCQGHIGTGCKTHATWYAVISASYSLARQMQQGWQNLGSFACVFNRLIIYTDQ